jgi:hypothetical protein
MTDAEIAEHVAAGGAGPRAGCCTDCGHVIWRTVEHPKLGRTILWPDPASLYAQAWTTNGPAVGIAYCPGCCPSLGVELHPSIVPAVWESGATEDRRLTGAIVMHHDMMLLCV